MTFDLKIRGLLPYELLVEVPSAAYLGRQLEQVSCLTSKAGLWQAESMAWSRVPCTPVEFDCFLSGKGLSRHEPSTAHNSVRLFYESSYASAC